MFILTCVYDQSFAVAELQKDIDAQLALLPEADRKPTEMAIFVGTSSVALLCRRHLTS